MKNSIYLKFKKILPFWQEIIFIFMLGSMLSGIITNASEMFQYTFNIVIVCIFLPVFICLIGQFFWKNLVLGMQLSIPLALGSMYMILAALSDLNKVPEGNTRATVGLLFAVILFVGLTITAISMPFKYRQGSDFMLKNQGLEKSEN